MAVTIAQVRDIALALPGAAEVPTWGELTWRVRDKIFVMGGGPESTSVSVKCTKEDQAELIAMAPQTYAVSAYVGRFGWVTVALSLVDADELRELIVDAWRRTAPKSAVKAYDAT